ncbi:MAG: LamG-like jellyroll fold domain-containing protein, partial [Verrucomicrobiota bacterium]
METKALFGTLTIALGLSAGTVQAGFSLSTKSGTYVVIPHNASLNITNNMLTVECWFNRQNGTTDWNSLVSKEPYSTTFSGFDLRFGNACPNPDIDLSPRSVYDDCIYAHNQGNHQLTSTNKWQHYAMQYDGTNYLVWVDGSLFFSTNCTAQIVVGSNPVHIGCQNSGWRPFTGWIAEVRISKSARYSRPFIPETRFATDTNTIALYHFDEGQGTTVADSSGNGNNGTIQG